MEAEVVAKGEFARLCNVSPGRVSQWISEGKIGPDALVGEGKYARIVVATARQQLGQRLDIGQRLSNGLSTRIDADASPAVEASAATVQPAAPRLPLAPSGEGLSGEAGPIGSAAPDPRMPRVRSIEDELKAEKLWQAQAARRRIEREERAERGLYTRTSDAAKANKKMAGDILSGIEGGIDAMSRVIAARFELPARDVIHLMRTEFKAVRARVSRELAAAAMALPEIDDDPVGDEAPAADDEETVGATGVDRALENVN